MGTFFAELSMSLDGYVAGPNDGPDNPMGDGGNAVFAWYGSGDTEFVAPGGHEGPVHISKASAELLQRVVASTGAIVTGRRTFENAGAWDGEHPFNVPVFVVTHHPDPVWSKKPESIFTFVTDGVESALRQAQAVAGDKNVYVFGPSLVAQALKLRMLDEIQVDLAPVLLGGGVSFFGGLDQHQIELVSQEVIEGTGVTHLIFTVKKLEQR